MARFCAFLIGYLFGCILFAVIVCRIGLKHDPTKVGSGNPGAANVGAVFGKKWGIITCLGDLLKTIACLALTYFLFQKKIVLVYAGLGLIAGHCFPFWNKFQGGKGVSVAVLLAAIYDVRAAAVTLLIALLLTIILKNLTVPPIIFILLYSVYETTQVKEAGFVLLIIAFIMIFKFRHDLRDFFTGNGKRVDVLYTIKKKLGIKADN